MTTAMQELIDDLKAEHLGLEELVRINKESGYQPDYAEGGMKRLEYAINKATELLNKEKEQIMDAYVDAQAHENRGVDSLAYYNKSYSL